MAFYTGATTAGSALDKLVELLTKTPQGATSPYWQKIGSGTIDNEGIILYSPGKSGKDKMYVRLRPSTPSRGIDMTMLETYTPNAVQGLAGTFTNESAVAWIAWQSSGGNSRTIDPITYFLSFDRDKIIVSLAGDRVLPSALRSVASVGTVERSYSPIEEPVINATYLATSANGNSLTPNSVSGANSAEAACTIMRSRDLKLFPKYDMVILGSAVMGMNSLQKAKGWNNTIVPSDLYLQGTGTLGISEGIRGKIGGIKHVVGLEFIDGEEMMIGSKRYTIFNAPAAINKTCWPGLWLAVEQIL